MERDNQIRDNQILELYQQGKSQREIARIIGISQPAVRKRLLKYLHPDNLITCPDCGSQDLWVCIYDTLHCSVCAPPKAPELVKEPVGKYYEIP